MRQRRPTNPSPEAHDRPAPRFLGQGLLILLPVALLALAGLGTLSHDRRIAEAEARQDAHRHALSLADALWPRLSTPPPTNDPSLHAFRIDASGRLLSPPPAPASAPDSALANSTRPADGAWSDAIARHERAAALAAQGRLEEALALWQDLTEAPSHFTTASGLPLREIARWRQLEARLRPATEGLARLRPGRLALPADDDAALAALATFASNQVAAPTFFTPFLIAQAATLARNLDPKPAADPVAPWVTRWHHHQTLRALARATLPALATTLATRDTSPAASPTVPAPTVPTLFWIETPGLSPVADQPALADPALPPAGNPAEDPAGTPDTDGRPAGQSSRRFNAVTFRAFNPTAWLCLGIPDPAPVAPSPATPATDTPTASTNPEPTRAAWVYCRPMMAPGPRGWTDPKAAPWDGLLAGLPTLPPWFGYSLEISGRTISPDPRLHGLTLKPAPQETGRTWTPVATTLQPEVLATATAGPAGDLPPALRVRIHLVSPEQLFARQRNRSRLFGGLIGLACLAAVIGVISARRAFLRQHQLASLKSNFVSSVSHELRAPLASVRLMAESLERGTIHDAARQQEYFRCIVQECRRLGTLIENVLDFSRIEQGRKRYEFAAADVTALVASTVHLLTPAALDRQVTLTARIEPLSPETATPLIDALAVQQALVNLIDNALKHAPPGSTVTVRLAALNPSDPPGDSSEGSARPMPAAPSSLAIAVTDAGPGIPAEEHHRIFERFYRRGSELRRETQGIGLGLSLVRHVAQAHGGEILVDSTPGRGSTFTLLLPAAPPRLPA